MISFDTPVSVTFDAHQHLPSVVAIAKVKEESNDFSVKTTYKVVTIDTDTLTTTIHHVMVVD